MKQFKIRCSAIGQIMTNSRKKGELSKTAQSYCIKWIKEQPEYYGRRADFSNKYTEKGLIMEDNALDLVADLKGYGLLLKNEESFENEYMTGVPDNLQPLHTIDTKCSFDETTFPLFETVLDSSYDWQGQGYMELTGRKEHRVYYCLMDTPINIIEREARNYCYRSGVELTQEIFDEFKDRMTFGTVRKELRLKEFIIKHDIDKIKAIESRVQECRNFIKSITS